MTLIYLLNCNVYSMLDFLKKNKRGSKDIVRDYYLCVFITTTYQYTITHIQKSKLLIIIILQEVSLGVAGIKQILLNSTINNTFWILFLSVLIELFPLKCQLHQSNYLKAKYNIALLEYLLPMIMWKGHTRI